MGKSRIMVDGQIKRALNCKGQKKKYYFTPKRFTCTECGKEMGATSKSVHFKFHRRMEAAGCANEEEYRRYKNEQWNKWTSYYQLEKKCIICSETRAIDVHHYDENNKNHARNNRVPLCCNHHRLLHLKDATTVAHVEKYVSTATYAFGVQSQHCMIE